VSKYVEQCKKLRAWWDKARSVITEAARTLYGALLVTAEGKPVKYAKIKC
jgi:hypothetical protein